MLIEMRPWTTWIGLVAGTLTVLTKSWSTSSIRASLGSVISVRVASPSFSGVNMAVRSVGRIALPVTGSLPNNSERRADMGSVTPGWESGL